MQAFIFLARRIQPFLSLVDREVEFCVLTIQSFSTRWAFFILFYLFLVRKIPFTGIELTSQLVRRLQGYRSELPGRPVVPIEKPETQRVQSFVVDVMHWGANARQLRSEGSIGWLTAGGIPNSLYRVPFFCFFSGMYNLCLEKVVACILLLFVYFRHHFCSCFCFFYALVGAL